MAGNKFGALKRKLGIKQDVPLTPGTLVAAKNKIQQKKLQDLANDHSIKGVAIKGLI
jgi:hypothetical protein